MNELHLKYQQDTGIQINKQINFINEEEHADDFSKLYDYIKWLEEKITTNEKDKNQHTKDYYDKRRNK